MFLVGSFKGHPGRECAGRDHQTATPGDRSSLTVEDYGENYSTE